MSNLKSVSCSAIFEPQIFSAAIKCAALGAPLPPNTCVTRQLEKRQKMHQHDKLRQKSVLHRTKRHARVIEKFDMYYQKGTDTNVGYVKRMTDPPYQTFLPQS